MRVIPRHLFHPFIRQRRPSLLVPKIITIAGLSTKKYQPSFRGKRGGGTNIFKANFGTATVGKPVWVLLTIQYPAQPNHKYALMINSLDLLKEFFNSAEGLKSISNAL